jgi:hypothetical protein
MSPTVGYDFQDSAQEVRTIIKIVGPLPNPSSYIRLIKLLPADVNAPLRCHVFTAPPTSLPKYKAISYVWGEQTKSASLAVRTTSLNFSEFFITPSLEVAMKEFRQELEPVVLWIDQICINQDDLAERNAQVLLMHHIYSQAEEVLIWLGLPAHGSDELVDTLQLLGEQVRNWGIEDYIPLKRHPELAKIIACENPKDPKTMEFRRLCKHYGSTLDLLALKAWSERAWFSRTWTIQEFCLGRRAIFACGKKRIDMDLVWLARLLLQPFTAYDLTQPLPSPKEMDEIRERMRQKRDLDNDPGSALYPMRRKWQNIRNETVKSPTLYQVLQTIYVQHEHVARGATNAKDRIYGLLALPCDTQALGIQPDYLDSTSVGTVYINTAAAIIQSGDIDLLGLSQFPKENQNLPSWTPDWCAKIKPSFSFEASSPNTEPLFSACGSSAQVTVAIKDNHLLELHGYIVDKIERVGRTWERVEKRTDFNLVAFQLFLSEVEVMCKLSTMRGHNIYGSKERQAEAFWRVPIGDLEETRDMNVRRARSTFVEEYHFCIESLQCEAEAALPAAQETPAYRERYQRLLSSSLRYTKRVYNMFDRRPFLSSTGYVGMGPTSMEPNDVIVVFCGSRVPYALRPKGDKFILLGEAYCDGAMDGEIVKLQQKQTFVLV